MSDRSATAFAASDTVGKSGRTEETARRLIARMSRAHLSGELAARITHEISNHLQVVLGNAELLFLADTLPDTSRRRLEWLSEAGRAAAAANSALRELSRGDDDSPRETADAPLSLDEALTRTASRLDRLASPARLDTTAIDTDAGASRLSAREMPPDLLCELLLRLVRHARAASGDTLALRAELLEPLPPDARISDARLRLGVRVDAPTAPAASGPRTPASEALPARRSVFGEGIFASGDIDETLSLDILAVLVELAGGRLDPGDGPMRPPPALVLPVKREVASP